VRNQLGAIALTCTEIRQKRVFYGARQAVQLKMAEEELREIFLAALADSIQPPTFQPKNQ
jgi:hypothetical protein